MAKKKENVNWVAWLMHNYRITFLLVGVMFVMGFIGLDKMAKAEFPDFSIRQGVVVAVYPGATAEEVEAQERWTARDAAYDAGHRRMVPIFLTTATTAMGVVPMIIEATSFWMPVGVTICAGGIGSLIMVVIMLPVIYWKLYEKKKDKQ